VAWEKFQETWNNQQQKESHTDRSSSREVKLEHSRGGLEPGDKRQKQQKSDEILRKARVEQINRMRQQDELRGIIRDSYENLVSKVPVRNSDGHILHFPTQIPSVPSNPSSTTKLCVHDGWWDKVAGPLPCENCSVLRVNYLLECPGCKKKACPSCQQTLRPRKQNNRRKKP